MRNTSFLRVYSFVLSLIIGVTSPLLMESLTFAADAPAPAAAAGDQSQPVSAKAYSARGQVSRFDFSNHNMYHPNKPGKPGNISNTIMAPGSSPYFTNGGSTNGSTAGSTSETADYPINYPIKNVDSSTTAGDIGIVMPTVLAFQPALAAIQKISGTISVDTTLKSNTIYNVTGSTTVAPGVTLTVEPGAIVKFNSGKNFTIKGTVRSNGTSNNKVYFTSIKDDAIGGDTNGDGSQTQPAAKNWSGFKMSAGSTVELSNTVVRYANQGIYYYAPSGSYYDSNYFIKKLSVQNCEISNCYHGIYMLGAQSALVSSSTIQNNSAFGMMIVHCENPDLHDNKISNNGTTGVNSKAVEIDPKALPRFVGNKLINNTQNGVWIWDAAQKATSTPNQFSFTGANATLFNGTTYILYGTTWVSPSTTFTIQAGTVIKGQPGALVVRGKLTANGQQALPITFTSYRDSTFGGNTNGSQRTPGTSDWGGIKFESGSTGTLSNVRIKHASTGISGTNASIIISNSILDKNGAGANNTTDSPEMKAINNWWGAANGPKPYGSGNKVVGKVAVKPWLTTAPF